MTAQEKAKELISKFSFLKLPECDAKFYNPKQCAIIAVEQLIDCTHSEDIIEENCCPVNGYDKNAKYTYEYWEKVKNELLKQQNNG